MNLDNAFDYLTTDLVYFSLEINDGTMWGWEEYSGGSVKFMRREFIGDLRNPPLMNLEDNTFYKKLKEKNPTESVIGTDVMYKHYNYPREGSLIWQVMNGKTKRGEHVT